MDVLTQRQLNRALLARQLLLNRVRAPIPRVLERIGGVQNQYAPNAYIRLWSCLESFRRGDLTRALERRTAVQGTLMRVTIHLVSARDFWPFAVGIRRSRQLWWMKTHKKEEPEALAAAERLRALVADGPRHRKEIEDEIGRGFHAGDLWHDLVRAPPSGTWERRRADLYASAEQWLGPPDVTPEDGLAHLVRSYLAGFGPATRNDIASYTGVQVTQLAPALERLRLRSFRDEQGRELLDVPRAPLPPADTPAPVRFLPTWDSTLLVHARRTGILPEEYRQIVFDVHVPPSMPTFLVDGAVAGRWRVERAADAATLVLEPFAPLPRVARREVETEAQRLLAWHEADAGARRVRWA
jgi:hypothetical protein